MTSNVGASTIKKQKSLGFSLNDDKKADNEYEKMKDNILEELKRSFRPEFLNRIDDIVVFHSLEEKDLQKIVRLMLKSVTERLKEQEIQIQFDEESEKLMTKEGSDLAYGARPLRRAITKIVEDKLSEEILKGNVTKGDSIKVEVEDSKLSFKKED